MNVYTLMLSYLTNEIKNINAKLRNIFNKPLTYFPNELTRILLQFARRITGKNRQNAAILVLHDFKVVRGKHACGPREVKIVRVMDANGSGTHWMLRVKSGQNAGCVIG